jgi:hypothetical protein
MAVATRGCHVEAIRNVPAEIAVEFVVSGSFGEHGAWSSIPDFSSWPGLSRPSTFLLVASFKDVDARDKRGHDEEEKFSCLSQGLRAT